MRYCDVSLTDAVGLSDGVRISWKDSARCTWRADNSIRPTIHSQTRRILEENCAGLAMSLHYYR
jgi:hypothetical protein